jgi:drug/metabolite transporter, DME family
MFAPCESAHSMNTSRLGTLFVLTAAVLWGTTGTAQALLPDNATPEVVGTIRLLIGGTALLLFAQFRGILCKPTRTESLPLVIGAVGVAVYQLAFFAGVSLTGVAVGTIVGIGSAPIMTGLLDWLVNRQPLTRRWMMATLLAIIGCALLTIPDAEVNINLFGILLAMGAGLSYAVYTLAGKQLLKTMPADSMVALVFGGAMFLLLPILLVGDTSWVFEPRGMLVALHLGLITLAVSYILFGRGLKLTPASTAVTLSLAEPLTAGLLGVLVVGEQLPPTAFLGIALLFAGLGFLTVAPQTSAEPAAIASESG